MIHIASRPLARRTFLRGVGATLALPFLDAMRPVFGAAASSNPSVPPRRMLAICTNLGVLDRHFYPTTTGRDYDLTPYLEILKDYREQFTVISGTSLTDVTGGHSAEATFLTGAPHPGTASFRNSVSLDQYAAERIGDLTRVSSLPLAVAKGGSQSISVTSGGVPLPAERSPAQVFKALFVAGSPEEVEHQVEMLRTGRSILDTIATRAASLQKKLGNADGDRIDQYFTSVREVERRLLVAEAWERVPKPKVDTPAPTDSEYLLEQISAMYDLSHLALTTDTTRLITLFIKLDGFSAHIPGVATDAHGLSHHVGREDKLEELKYLEIAQFKQLAGLFKRLQSTSDGDTNLLDRTQVLYGSNLGNGNNHDNRNLPIVLAGGGYKHGQHLAFDRDNNYPLANLYVTMLQRLGLETDKFSSSKSTMKGLEFS